MLEKNPLDYRSPQTPSDPIDSGVGDLWWVRWANRRRRGLWPSKLRIVYWVVMLTAIGLVLWHLRNMLQPYMDLMK